MHATQSGMGGCQLSLVHNVTLAPVMHNQHCVLLVKTYIKKNVDNLIGWVRSMNNLWLNAGNPMLTTLDRNQVYLSVSSAAAVHHQSQCSIIITL